MCIGTAAGIVGKQKYTSYIGTGIGNAVGVEKNSQS